VAIHCPYCDHLMKLKPAKAGRYGPRCTRCGYKFLVDVSDPAREPRVKALPKDKAKPKSKSKSRSQPEDQQTVATTSNGGRSESRRSRQDSKRDSRSADSGTRAVAATRRKQHEAQAHSPPKPQSSEAESSEQDHADLTAMFDSLEAEQTTPPEAIFGDQPDLGGDDLVDPEGELSGGGTLAAGSQIEGEQTPAPADTEPTQRLAARHRVDPPQTGTIAAADASAESQPVQQSQPEESESTRAATVSAGSDQDASFTLASDVDGIDDWETAAAPGTRDRQEDPPRQGTVASGQASAPKSGSGAAAASIPQVLGGYRIEKELGRGAMGAVYLARQLSLDRNVALKVIQTRLASDPAFIARFTREAYAAAQLAHHNVVQIYDLCEEKDINFFSMEFVDGENLSSVITSHGKLSPKEAVGYILQAARGLKFAHDHGLIHRDIKPDNLMVNRQGIVKVADLGLVKHVGAAGGDGAESMPADSKLMAASQAGVTVAEAAMGTPAYMPPEQSENAAGVDQRADIYSLGCTLYVMLTGRPPFQGTTALEVMTKHKTEAIRRPDAVQPDVPAGLAEINLKMMAKRPEDRYCTMDEVIAALSQILSGDAAGEQTLAEQHIEQLERDVSAYNSHPLARLRRTIGLGFAGACGVAFLCSLLFMAPLFAGGVLAFAASTALTAFVLRGVREHTYLFSKVREYFFASSIADWVMRGVGALLVLLALWLFGLLWTVLGFCVIGAGLGVAYDILVRRRLTSARTEQLDELEDMFKRLRVRGMDESDLRGFVAEYGGNHWEEIFEDLFGYEAKLQARVRLDTGGKDRRRAKFGAWRDPLIRRIDQRLSAAREARELKHLKKVEAKKLQAQGLDAGKAREQAERRAEAMVGQAAEIRAAAAEEASGTLAGESAEQKRARIKAMLAQARGGETVGDGKHSRIRRGAGAIGLLFGQRARFLAGCALLILCGMWVQQNEALSGSGVREAIERRSLDASNLELLEQPDAATLELPMLRESVRQVVSGFHVGVAGLLLLISSWFRNLSIAVFAWPGAAVALLGASFGMPAIAALSPAVVSMAASVALFVVGLVLSSRS